MACRQQQRNATSKNGFLRCFFWIFGPDRSRLNCCFFFSGLPGRPDRSRLNCGFFFRISWPGRVTWEVIFPPEGADMRLVS